VLLDKLESGFLLLDTPQGLMRVEPSFRQRVRLLWAFRNFRQLSVPLLTSRQRALVNDLFRNNAGAVSQSDNRFLVIGVVENFVPPVVACPARRESQDEEQVQVEEQAADIALIPDPVPAFTASTRPLTRHTWSRLATAVGALSLCMICVSAWHRIPGSQAQSQPEFQQPELQQISPDLLPDSAFSAKSASVAETLAAVVPAVAVAPPAVAPAAVAMPIASPETVVEPAQTSPKPIAKIETTDAVVPASKRQILVHDAAPASQLPLTSDDSSIQATRAPLHFVYPVYADIRARGVVALTARVESDGTVHAVRVVSGNRALAAAAVRAVRQWRYRPYLKDGEPVATETNIVISFISSDAISMSFPPAIPATR
jgi:TonB family protein